MKIVSYLKTINKSQSFINTKSVIESGLGVGVPLNIFSDVFSSIHYGNNILTPEIILIQFLIGYYAYGYDRLNDAIEYEITNYETEKEGLYKNIQKNKKYYKTSLELTFLIVSYYLFASSLGLCEEMCVLGVLYSTKYYSKFKVNLGVNKTLYIGIMWTLASVVLPCLLSSKHILTDESFLLDATIPFTIISASSTIADIKDYNEDLSRGVKTWPVVIGIKNTVYLTTIGLWGITYFLITHDNFDSSLLNSIVCAQSLILSFMTLKYLGNNKE
jgi:hypothetical protein